MCTRTGLNASLVMRATSVRVVEYSLIRIKMDEHSTSDSNNSAVAGHTLDDPEIYFESDLTKRKIEEAVFIQEQDPSLNKQVESYKLLLFNIPWSDVYQFPCTRLLFC